MGMLLACTAPASSDGTPFALADLTGSWELEGMVLQISDDGSYAVAPTADIAHFLFQGFVARDGELVNFVTSVGGECAGTTGVYGVSVSGGELRLRLVEDPCEVRAHRFEGAWARSD